MYFLVPKNRRPAPAPFNDVPGREYSVRAGMRIYIKSPRSESPNARWVMAVVKHWDAKSNVWRVKVIQDRLIETGWMASLIEGRWKPRRKLTPQKRGRA